MHLLPSANFMQQADDQPYIDHQSLPNNNNNAEGHHQMMLDGGLLPDLDMIMDYGATGNSDDLDMFLAKYTSNYDCHDWEVFNNNINAWGLTDDFDNPPWPFVVTFYNSEPPPFCNEVINHATTTDNNFNGTSTNNNATR